MAYRDIDNLYKNQDIFLFRECYALEKIHGTSAHVRWRYADGAQTLGFFAGGCKQDNFCALFNQEDLVTAFAALGQEQVIVFGEAYGAKIMKMSDTYGKDLLFIAFEVKIGESWLAVPQAESVARSLGFDFVPYVQGPATLEFLDAQRDAPSVQAAKNGMGADKQREGVVVRPLLELRKNNGERIVVKHKGENFRETTTPRQVDPEKLRVLAEAQAIADEWVTEMRLTHVLDAFGPDVGMEQAGEVIRAMIADVEREGQGEIVESKMARTAIGRRTAQMLKDRLQSKLARSAPREAQ